MKSILIITQEIKVGGLGTHLRSEISSLAGAGCCVHLAAGSLPNGFLIPPEVASVTSILPLGAKATVSDLKATVEALGQLVREHSIECVHAHSHVSLIPGFIAAEMNAIPFVMTLESMKSVPIADYGPLYDFILRSIILPMAGMVVAVSTKVAGLAAPYLAKNEVLVLSSGMDVVADVSSRINESNAKEPYWQVSETYSETDLWQVFHDKIRGLAPQPATVLGDTYHAIEANEVGEAASFCQSAFFWEQLGTLIYSCRHFDPKLAADYLCTTHKFMEERLAQTLAEQTAQITGIKQVLKERDEALHQGRTPMNQALAERDEAQRMVETMLNSRSWRLTRPLRYAARTARHGLGSSGETTVSQQARAAYHRLPAGPLKSAIRRLAAGVLGWQQSNQFSRTTPRRRIETWADFDGQVLSHRTRFRGIFIQSKVIPWDLPLYQRPQHIAVALGKIGYLVIYRTTSDFESRDMQAAEEIAENVWLTGFDEVEDLRGVVTSYYSTTYWHSKHDFDASSKQGAVVYEYIDHIDPAITGENSITKLEELREYAFAGGVDYIIASARVLEDEARRSVESDKVIYVPNGVDYAHYQSARNSSETTDLPTKYKRFLKSHAKVIGYFGAMAPWLWYSLLRDLVELRKDLGFVFIGPDYLGAAKNLPQAGNVLWTGPIDYKSLPVFASEFDVAIIPFEPGDIARTTSPLKLFEYFALGKPVIVTSEMRECVIFEEVLSAESATEFSLKLDEALKLSSDPDFMNRLLHLAQKNDWTARAEAMGILFSGLNEG